MSSNPKLRKILTLSPHLAKRSPEVGEHLTLPRWGGGGGGGTMVKKFFQQSSAKYIQKSKKKAELDKTNQKTLVFVFA